MDTLGDLLARDRRSDDPAVEVHGDPTVEYSYADFVTTAWKTAHFFRGRGVHRGATVAVVDDAAVAPLLALFGAAQLGAVTQFGPPGTVDARVLVGPGERVLEFDLPPGATRVAYTAGQADVEAPDVEPFGRSVWSENPVRPPEEVPPDATALATDGTSHDHRELLDAAGEVAGQFDPGTRVVVRAPLADPPTVVAGVLAPLRAGATVVLPDDGDDDPVGDVVVGPGPEPRTVHLSGVQGDAPGN